MTTRTLLTAASLAALSAWLWPVFLTVVPPRYPARPTLYTPYGEVDAREHCHKVESPSLRFCEDVIPDGDGYIASCDGNRGRWNTVMGPFADPLSVGNLSRVEADGRVRQVELAGPPAELQDFHPLGLHLHEDKLWVVNHRCNASMLTEFHFDRDRHAARFIRHLPLATLHTPNAIARLSNDLLLVTNDHRVSRKTSAIAQTAETMLQLPGGSVMLVDTTHGRARTIISGIPFANGVVHLPSKGLLIVASTTRRSILVYRLSDTSAYNEVEAERIREIKLGFNVDNLSVDGDDYTSVIAAGHPSGLSLIALANAPYATGQAKRVSGSRVAKVNVESGEVESLFFDDGRYFRSSSTAIYASRAGRLVVSGLYEDGLLACDVSVPS